MEYLLVIFVCRCTGGQAILPSLTKKIKTKENLKSHEHAEFSRLARCMISLKSTLIGCKITGFENSYVCIIPTQFLWGQGSSVLTNKHTNSCSPPKSHLAHINQMEGNEMWESISQCLPKRRGRWRLLKTAPPISLSYRIGRKEEKPIVVWLTEYHDSTASCPVFANTLSPTYMQSSLLPCCLVYWFVITC